MAVAFLYFYKQNVWSFHRHLSNCLGYMNWPLESVTQIFSNNWSFHLALVQFATLYTNFVLCVGSVVILINFYRCILSDLLRVEINLFNEIDHSTQSFLSIIHNINTCERTVGPPNNKLAAYTFKAKEYAIHSCIAIEYVPHLRNKIQKTKSGNRNVQKI